MTATWSATLGLVCLLGGCAVPLPRETAPSSFQAPAGWSVSDAAAPGRATSLAQWWSRFDDPILAGLVVQAEVSNTDITRAQAALRQALALRDVSAAGLRPQLGGTASAQRSRANNSSASNFRVGLEASWDPDLFGGNRSAVDASQAAALARAATLGDVQVSTAAAVALAYITLRANQARFAIAAANLAGQQETLQLTQWRVQAGLLSSLEGEQARAAAEQTGAQLPALQSAIEQGAHVLALLTGQTPAALEAQLAAPSALPQPPDDLVLAIPAETLRQRADVRAAEYQVSAAVARVAGAEAARLPSFRLSGNLGLSALTLGALGNGAALASGVLAGLSLPMFDGGAAHAQVRAQQAALDEAGAAYQATVLTALREVEDSLVALRADRVRIARLRDAADAAGNAALLARQRYSSGLVDFQTVLETQRTQRSAQDAVVAAAADFSSDHVRLYAALGGGWRSEDANATTAAQRVASP